MSVINNQTPIDLDMFTLKLIQIILEFILEVFHNDIRKLPNDNNFMGSEPYIE